MFKIRSSAISKIMGKRGLGKTGESVCQEWIIEQQYKRRKEFSNKYTEKGLINEDEAIDLASEHYDLGFILKNEKWFEGDFITGTPDIILNDRTIDIKCSWDIYTFPLFETEVKDEYKYQGLGYMELTGKKVHEVVFVLTDTPIHLIEREVYNYARQHGIEDVTTELFDEFHSRMTYSDIPIEKRIKKFTVNYNESEIELINSRVKECREYIDKQTKAIQ